MSYVEFYILDPGHDLQAYPWMGTQADFRECQEWLKSGLDALRSDNPWEISFKFAPSYIVQLKTPQVQRRTPPGPPLIPFREALFLDSIPILRERLRFCARPECGRAFLKHKRQIYCRRACSLAQRSARFRKKHAEELAEKQHARYVRRMEEKHGRRFRIKRRPRRRSE